MVQDWNMIEGSIVLTSCYAEEQKGEGGGVVIANIVEKLRNQ